MLKGAVTQFSLQTRGGRISLQSSSITPEILANLTVTGNAAGTIFYQIPSTPNGNLVVDNRGSDSPENGTPLPFVGTGSISALTPDTLVCDTCHFPKFSGLHGLRVEVNPSYSHVVADQFVILWNDSTKIVVDTTGGKSLNLRATVGNPFTGVILLDTVRVRGKAKVYSLDPVQYKARDVIDGKFFDPEGGLISLRDQGLPKSVIAWYLEEPMPMNRTDAETSDRVALPTRPVAVAMHRPASASELLAQLHEAHPAQRIAQAEPVLRPAAMARPSWPSATDLLAQIRPVPARHLESVAVTFALPAKPQAPVMASAPKPERPRSALAVIAQTSAVPTREPLQKSASASIMESFHPSRQKTETVATSATQAVFAGWDRSDSLERESHAGSTFASRFKTPVGTIDSTLPRIACGGLDPQYTYDILGRRTSMTDPTGVTRYEYDTTSGNLSAIVDPNGGRYEFNYRKGQMESLRYPNGMVATSGFDSLGNLTALDYAKGSTKVAQFHYGYDDNGLRTSMTDNDGQHDYGYDVLNQLVSATHPRAVRPTEQFTYDAVGNRLTQDDNPFVWQYDDLNRLQEDDKFRYEYDLDGNMVQKASKVGQDTTRYVYNVENKMIRVERKDTTVSFVYDALGRRLAKTVNGKVKQYRYDGDDLILELDAKDSIVAKYTFGPGIDRPLSMTRNATTLYYIVDALGSVRALANDSAQVVQEYRYGTFGEILEQTGTIENPFTYTAREWDSEIGLYYYRARFYDAKIGRFLSEDPEGMMDGVNLYVYVSGSPISVIDPFGLSRNFADRFEQGANGVATVAGAIATIAAAAAVAPGAASAIASIGLIIAVNNVFIGAANIMDASFNGDDAMIKGDGVVGMVAIAIIGDSKLGGQTGALIEMMLGVIEMVFEGSPSTKLEAIKSLVESGVSIGSSVVSIWEDLNPNHDLEQKKVDEVCPWRK